MKHNEIVKRTKYQSICDNVNFRAVQDEDGTTKMRFEGYAIVFGQRTVLFEDELGNEYAEIIDKDSLNNTDMNDVPLRYNHETSWVLARTRKKTGPGSLILTKDDFGLKVQGEFVDMQYSRDVYAMMLAEVINQMSFAFTVRDYSFDSATRTTTIKDIDKLFDVSVVDSPAYPQTSISACRCAEEAEAEAKAKQESLELENKKEEVKAKLENLRQSQVEKLKKRITLNQVMEKLKVKEI